MKLLHVIASMNPSLGGPNQGLRNLVPELKKLGAQIEVVCLDVETAPFLGRDPFQIHTLGPSKKPWYYSKKLVPWLLVNLERFDVVIVHGLWLYHGYAVQKVVRHWADKNKHRKAPKVFVMPHGMLDPYFQRAKSRRLKAVRNWFYWKLIEKRIINRADALFFTCESELLLAREPFQAYHPKREINVGYGVAEPPQFTPAMRKAFLDRCPEVDGHPYLLFLSRIHEKKGVDLLLKAFEDEVSKGDRPTIDLSGPEDGGVLPKKEPRLVIAGPGLETHYGQRMRQRVARSPRLRDKVFFPGMLSGDSKWGAFYGCEAFVLPSHQENFGIAVAEALACGRPVLISDQVNIWREIEGDGGGFVASDNAAGTLQLLDSWLDLLPEEKQGMAKRARQTFERNFAVEPAAHRLWQAINS